MTKKILIVDDEPAILELVERILARKSYRILTATDGKKALETVIKESPDLVILDVMLPEMDGWQVCRSIREDPIHKNTPIIMLTVRKSDEDQIKGLNLGSDEYITKPFYPKELALRVQRILQKQPA